MFESWITFEERVEADGRRTYIIAICPLEEYKGTKHEVDGAKKMHEATSRGVHIVKELTENTCEWTRVQQVDLKITALPATVLDITARQHLGWANEYQERFRRNWKEVDREGVAALAKVIKERRGVALLEDQIGVFERCSALLREGVGEGWKVLEPISLEVEMKVKYFLPGKGGRSVVTGKTVGDVDCSVEEVAAWLMDYCSKNRVRISMEEGNPARLELRKLMRENEMTFATVKKMPFMLDNREFVTRQIWRSEEGKALIAFEPVDVKVDYGTALRTTRGSARGFWVIDDRPTRGGSKQCRVTFVTQLDAGEF